MTSYGTIQTQSSNGNDNISRAKERIYTSIGRRRPWMDMFQLQSLTLPSSFLHWVDKIRKNAIFFRTNYLIIILFLFFFSLIWHPFSLVVFTVLVAAWWYLYFLHEGPFFVFGIEVHEKLLLIVMSIVTLIVLMVTEVRDNIMGALFFGVLIMLGHGSLRSTDDLVVGDGEEEAAGYLPSFQISAKDSNVPLRNAASSFSS